MVVNNHTKSELVNLSSSRWTNSENDNERTVFKWALSTTCRKECQNVYLKLNNLSQDVF